MKIVTGTKMAQIDREAISRFEIPGLILMENAGLQVVRFIQRLRPELKEIKAVILCGKGNNGGDGFVIARHLRRLGCRVETWAMGGLSEYKGDAAANYNILLKDGYEIYRAGEKDLPASLRDLRSADLVVDALLGTGIQRNVSEPYEEIITAVNGTRALIVAVDIPSGISADSGEVMGAAVKAQYTVTFALPKRGLLLFPGAEYAGKVIVTDIGIPKELTSSAEISENLITGHFVQNQLPQRALDSHKGSSGRVLILAGSTGMTGAAALAGEAALRGGAGLVYVGTAAELSPVLEAKIKEVIVLSFAGDGRGNLVEKDASEIINKANSCQVLALGPGLKGGWETLKLLKSLILGEISVPVLVDAGGLSALSLDAGLLLQKKVPFILTPHPGEMSRLLGISTDQVQKERWELASRQAREWETVLVLKGAYTVIAMPDGEIYINPTGNPVLSTAGTGDLLTGIIAALVAQGLEPGKAAVCGAYLHGLSADLLAAGSGGRGFTAGDILEFLPAAINETSGLSPVVSGDNHWI
ncbi:MAG: NAD(P)H-hydrate dehydratase [Bacillota bacterium]|nr:NAD(P)H-hydrate dehydratase [Bacillota bacterium]